ncbi:MAG: hypothetical protein R3D25_23075 [Geminicoccaceae bacterium]
MRPALPSSAVPQGLFLQRLGIDLRLERLLAGLRPRPPSRLRHGSG